MYRCSTHVEFICLDGVLDVLSGPIPFMSYAELDAVLSDSAPPTCNWGPRSSPVIPGGVSGEERRKGSTMNAPVRTSPSSGVSSEAVAEIKFSREARKRAARALFIFFGEPCRTRAMENAAMRHRSGSDCELDRAMTVRIRTDVRVPRDIPVTC